LRKEQFRLRAQHRAKRGSPLRKMVATLTEAGDIRGTMPALVATMPAPVATMPAITTSSKPQR